MKKKYKRIGEIKCVSVTDRNKKGEKKDLHLSSNTTLRPTVKELNIKMTA